jgi:hypothetical protein
LAKQLGFKAYNFFEAVEAEKEAVAVKF